MGPSMSHPAILWFRRDLRLRDHPALAAAGAGPVAPLFVLDPALLRPAGAPRVAMLVRNLAALDDELRRYGARLTIRSGRPEEVVPAAAVELGAQAVHVSADFGPYGSLRDRRVARALGSVPLVRSGSPYAVPPGAVRTQSGKPPRIFSAFARGWRAAGWPAPVPSDPGEVRWAELDGDELPGEPPLPFGFVLPDAGEQAAWAAWRRFFEGPLLRYAEDRHRPDRDGTSRLSVHLKWGTVHPRTLLADLAAAERGPGPETFRTQLAWRDFYGALLAAWPQSARQPFRAHMADLVTDADPDGWVAWTTGRTGYPLVDAGMRQLMAEGWMPNRVRMVTASFLVKDLHQDWRRGARHFMAHLVDGDLASNQHGWQWTAGTGTDAAPYHRILNPLTQARRFDPDGIYVRRWVPELAGLETLAIFEPWRASRPPAGYPPPIVDHATARAEALARVRSLR